MVETNPSTPKPFFHVILFSRVTHRSSLLVSAVDREDAKRQGWNWINRHGFHMIVLDAVTQEEWERQHPKDYAGQKGKLADFL